MLRLSKHQTEIVTQIARKKGVKPDVFLLNVLLGLYRETFKKDYLL